TATGGTSKCITVRVSRSYGFHVGTAGLFGSPARAKASHDSHIASVIAAVSSVGGPTMCSAMATLSNTNGRSVECGVTRRPPSIGVRHVTQYDQTGAPPAADWVALRSVWTT